MPDLKEAVSGLVAIIVGLLVLLLGDYLGYKFGRLRLLVITGFVALTVIIAYAIYSFVVLYVTGGS